MSEALVAAHPGKPAAAGADGRIAAAPSPGPLDALAPLLAATASGDRGAFAALYEAAAPRLLALALRLLRRRELAEEALQDCFVEVWRQAGRFDPARGSPLGWMASILRHRAIDLLRRVPRGEESAPETLEALADQGPGAFELVADNQEAARVLRCLDRLEDGPRRSLMLAYYEGLTQEEVSRRLDSPLGTVKSWIRRGLLGLRGCLEARP